MKKFHPFRLYGIFNYLMCDSCSPVLIDLLLLKILLNFSNYFWLILFTSPPINSFNWIQRVKLISGIFIRTRNLRILKRALNRCAVRLKWRNLFFFRWGSIVSSIVSVLKSGPSWPGLIPNIPSKNFQSKNCQYYWGLLTTLLGHWLENIDQTHLVARKYN